VKFDEKKVADNSKADVKAKDASGNTADPNKKPSAGNIYISIYDKEYQSVTYSENKDYKGVKTAIDEYTKTLADVFKVGGAAAGASSGSPMDIVKSLFSNSDTIINSVGSIVKTSLNLASVSNGVGITSTNEKTFIPGGIYVCNLIYSANSSIQTSSKTQVATMCLCRTIVATSIDLINAMLNQQLISQQMVLLGNKSLDVQRKQGEILGWSKVYPKYITLSVSKSKSQYTKVSQEMAAYLAADKFKFTDQEPDISGKNLQDMKVYAEVLEMMKQYGIWSGYKSAKELVDALIEGALDADDMSDAKDIITGSKEDLKELKTNSLEDYDKFVASFDQAVDQLRKMLGQ